VLCIGGAGGEEGKLVSWLARGVWGGKIWIQGLGRHGKNCTEGGRSRVREGRGVDGRNFLGQGRLGGSWGESGGLGGRRGVLVGAQLGRFGSSPN